jgi:hypothetical protein
MELLKRLTQLGPLKFGRAAGLKASAASMTAYEAVIADKIALIDKLPSKYRREAQDAVWNAVTNGHDAPGLARELQARLGFAPERARLVAGTQLKMARAVIENAQLIEQGETEAVWVYDREHCGVPIHQGLHGRRYALTQGADCGGRRIWPSGEPSCTCTRAEAMPANGG